MIITFFLPDLDGGTRNTPYSAHLEKSVSAKGKKMLLEGGSGLAVAFSLLALYFKRDSA